MRYLIVLLAHISMVRNGQVDVAVDAGMMHLPVHLVVEHGLVHLHCYRWSITARFNVRMAVRR